MAVYVCQLRECRNACEPVWKIGATRRTILERIKEYPKGSELMWTCPVRDPFAAKAKANDLLKAHPDIKQRCDMGQEYFEGRLSTIISVCALVAVEFMDVDDGVGPGSARHVEGCLGLSAAARDPKMGNASRCLGISRCVGVYKPIAKLPDYLQAPYICFRVGPTSRRAM